MKRTLFILILLPGILVAQNKFPYKNLVMEGGGIRGLAYSGALEVLGQNGILDQIENVGGSSVGAIAGLLISVGYDPGEIDSILQILRIQEFNDGKFFIGKIRRIRKEYGVYKGDKFQSWLETFIEKKTGNKDLTFYDLHQLKEKDFRYKDFYCTGTNISQQKLATFSWKTWPYMKLSTAVHISGCIPFYFVPVAIDSTGKVVDVKSATKNDDFYVDGGMLCNFPINLFDSCTNGGDPLICDKVIYNHSTLGLKLERGDQINYFDRQNTAIAPYDIKNMKEYSSAVMNLMMESLNRKTPQLENEAGRTIYISYGDISGKPRKISSEEKKLLHDNGTAAATSFLKKYEASNSTSQL